MARLAPAAAAIALLGCNTGFEPQYLVTDLRILAVKTTSETRTTCDVMPGDVLRLEALVANPLGRTITLSWFACPPVPGENSPCDPDSEFMSDPVGLAGNYEGRVLFLGKGESPLVPVPVPAEALKAALLVASNDATFECKLFVPIPLVVVAEGGGRREVARKFVVIVPTPDMLPSDIPYTPPPGEIVGAYVVNANPDVYGVASDPASRDDCTGGVSVGGADPLPSGRTVLCGQPMPDYPLPPAPLGYVSAQDFMQCVNKTDRTWTKESLAWQWYVTAGRFPQVGGEGNAMGSSIDFQRPDGEFTLWAIVRDGRGGVGWTTLHVR